MNNEAKVVMAFFTFRVFLVGAIMLTFPRIARKGLMFGTYLGEEQAEGTRRQLLRSWDAGTGLTMAVALIVGWSIGLTGRWVPGNLIGTVVLLVPFVPLYFWMYRRARGLTPPSTPRQSMKSAAPLEVDDARGEGFALFAIGVCVAGAVALVGYAFFSFQSMPDQIQTLANLWDYGDELTEKSLVSVVLVPAFNLVFAPAFAGWALLVARAKRSVRGGTGGRSSEAQATFRVAMSHLFAGLGLSTCLFLGVTSLEMIEVWQGRTESPGIATAWAAGVAIVFMGVSLVRILRLGQGGARLESGSPEAPLTGALADNARWILGVMYVDPTDPAVLVEARFGIGYTMNLGNRIAQVLLAVYLMGLLGLTLLTLAEIGVL